MTVWALLALTILSGIAVDAYVLPTIEYSELLTADSIKSLAAALSGDGIVAISKVPGLRDVRNLALGAVADCVAAAAPSADILTRQLPDGTLRRTIAAQIKRGSRSALSVASTVAASACDHLDAATAPLREAVDRVAALLAPAMDAAILSDTDGRMREVSLFQDAVAAQQHTSSSSSSSSGIGRSWNSFSSIVGGGDHLEHFHTYETPAVTATDATADAKALEYHTDAGLFIVFVPALYHTAEVNSQSHFYFSDSSGREHSVVVQEAVTTTATTATAGAVVLSSDSLVVMVGQGAEQWINPQLRAAGCPQQLRAVPHALDFRSDSANTKGATMMRSWYGRMFLPPEDAWLPQQSSAAGVTAAALRGAPQLRSNVAAASSSAAAVAAAYFHPAACGVDTSAAFVGGSGTVQLPVNALASTDCFTGDIYCWMQCMSPSDYNLTCPMTQVTCVDTDGNAVDPDEMDSSHRLGCEGVAVDDDGDAFCRGSAVTMYMQGFVSYLTGKYRERGGSETPQCLALWFEEWELDSKSKFNWACIGCLLLGVCTEAVSWIRRHVKAMLKGQSLLLEVPIMCFLYAGQLTLGYFDMLVAMTYQVELFVSVVLGLAAGHGVFSILLLRLGKTAAASGDVVAPISTSIKSASAVSAANDERPHIRSQLLPTEEEDVVDPCCQYLHVEED